MQTALYDEETERSGIGDRLSANWFGLGKWKLPEGAGDAVCGCLGVSCPRVMRRKIRILFFSLRERKAGRW